VTYLNDGKFVARDKMEADRVYNCIYLISSSNPQFIAMYSLEMITIFSAVNITENI
jgi:hypothetical protein